MAFSYRDLFFGGTTFCCCLPVRVGVLIMSFLGMLLSGILSIILWFEVASTPDMTSGEKAAFVCAGLVETLLFAFCRCNRSKATLRDDICLFYILPFVLNVGVAIWLLWLVTHGTENAAVNACQRTIQNPDAQNQCIGLLKVAKGVYIGIALVVLLAELYGAFIVARYVNQIQREKRGARASRMSTSNESAFKLVPQRGVRYSSVPGGQHITHLSYDGTKEFDPYREVGTPPLDASAIAGRSFSYGSPPPLVATEEAAYGGGSWTHEQISVEEKERLKQQDIDMGILPAPPEGEVGPHRDTKSPDGPPPNPSAIDELPRYTLSDPPSSRV
ncbi:hypothetical protein EYR36_003808 [Pleurotus pulmonarius]|nr:hypothetical protein EYR36_003808 [Pleurotus pulmonarius]